VLYGQDGTLTITMSDGTIYTSEYSMKGPKGDQGNTGEPGEKGDPGFSPIANVSRSGNTVTISITDANGTTTADVLDGAKGDKGATGDTGATGNGIVSITKTGTAGLIDTYTITYTNGATDTFRVKNGENGSGSVSDVWVDGISVLDGDTAKIDLSGKADIADLATVATSGSYNDLANKPTIPSAVTESTVSGWGFTKNTGTYSKPSGGIPKTDLATAVQASLEKADTALQSYTETDPTVPAWAKAANKPTYTASEVGAQPTLVSGTNIKTVTGSSLLGPGDLLPSAVGYTTVIPTAANTTGLKFVLCDSEPSTKYDGWVYLIKES